MNREELALFILIVLFTALSLYMYLSTHKIQICQKKGRKEGMNIVYPSKSPCPNLLIRQNGEILLYNTTQPEDSSNPRKFLSIKEYISYAETLQLSGQSCPLLYLQQEYDAQGNEVYRVRPGLLDPQGGLPVHQNHIPAQRLSPAPIFDHAMAAKACPDLIPGVDPQYYQKCSSAVMAGAPFEPVNYDPSSSGVGQYTVIDMVHDSTASGKVSDNPADPNWGGVAYSQTQIDSGKYAGNEVSLYVGH